MKIAPFALSVVSAAVLATAIFAQAQAKEIHSTDALYPAVGPYSQMVQAGNMLFLSGVIPLNKEGNATQGDTIEEQTRLVLDYIGAKLESRGLGYEDVVMSNVFLQDLNHFGAMNAIYGEYFHTDPPARATVEVARLPRDVLIEIAVVAYISD
ncbi:reactive intermediate/imine deaminase [Natronocella acetinitrilica]|uniref:Reactive intermediate/imine deaminase n=1 Tax=Natronocella acetinitrilica TaxID=414046 RepID=A0AAE3G2X6_9GAMM|nr:Rid family detoxifying hydrolase [Natronocella acetinitrilica]MCP1674664.1 reactive intermediate/imine deaminase [Natronocella acetinitrilica]